MVAVGKIPEKTERAPDRQQDGEGLNRVARGVPLEADLVIDHTQDREEERRNMENAQRIKQPEYHFELRRAGTRVAVGKIGQRLRQVARFHRGCQEVAVGFREPFRGVAEDIRDRIPFLDTVGHALAALERGPLAQPERVG